MFVVFLFLFSFNSFSQQITILHTNDLHSRFTGPYPSSISYEELLRQNRLGHYANLSGLIKKQKENAKNVLLIDAGDFYSGSFFHLLAPREDTKSFPEYEFFKWNKYNAVTLGNHEFDAGDKGFLNMLSKVDTSEGVHFVSTNFYSNNESENDVSKLIKKSVLLKTKSGINVGIIGAMGPDACLLSKANRSMFKFYGLNDKNSKTNWKELVDVLQRSIDELKSKGADIIVLSIHGGGEEDEYLAKNLKNLNVIIAGHTHQRYYKKISNVHIAQTGSYGTHLGVMNFDLDSKRKIINFKSQFIPVDSSFTDKDFLEHIQKRWLEVKSILKKIDIDPDKKIFESHKQLVRSSSEMSHWIGDNILKGLRLDEKHVYLSVKGLTREGIEKGKKYYFDDLFRILPLGFHNNYMPGSSLVRFYLKKNDFKKVIMFLDFYSNFNHKFTPSLSSNVSYEKKWWGIPLFNKLQNFKINNLDLSNVSEFIPIITNSYVAKYLDFAGQKTFGLFDFDIYNSQHEKVESVEVLNKPEFKSIGDAFMEVGTAAE